MNTWHVVHHADQICPMMTKINSKHVATSGQTCCNSDQSLTISQTECRQAEHIITPAHVPKHHMGPKASAMPQPCKNNACTCQAAALQQWPEAELIVVSVAALWQHKSWRQLQQH